MPKLKVLHLIKSLGRGGAEMLLPETLRVHDRDQFEFAYGYFVPSKDQLVESLEKLAVEVHCFSGGNPVKLLLQVPAVVDFAKSWGADIIHCHLPLAGVVGRIAGKVAGIPVIYTEHNLQNTYHPATKFLNLATFKWQDTVIAVSDQVKQSIHQHYQHKQPEVKLLLNGVNTARFDPTGFNPSIIRDQLNIPGTAKVIGTVCVFREQKQLDKWLDLAQLVWLQEPDTHFFLVGDGPEEMKLKEKVRAFGMSAYVHFPGRLEEVRPWLVAMDIYLMTSAYEGLPVAMLEAMSMGLPIVSTPVGGIPEVVQSGKEGHLCEIEEMPAYLFGLLKDQQRTIALGTNARQKVEAHFSINTMAKSLEQLYQGVIRAKR